MIFKNKELIIFDLDGTLIDSVPDLALSLNKMLERLEYPTYDEDTIRYWVGNGAQTLVKRALLGKKEIDEEIESTLFDKALDTFLKIYTDNVCVQTKAYEHVISTLNALHEKKYTLAIVTNKPYAFVAPILQTLEIDHLFSSYLGGDSLEKKKPDPLPLVHISQHCGVDVHNCIMIGDSKNDILAAKEANMQSIAVSYGYNYGEDITLHEPDLIIDDFSKLIQHIQ